MIRLAQYYYKMNYYFVCNVTMAMSPYVTFVRVAWFGCRNRFLERNTISRFRCRSHARLLAAVCWVTLSRTATRSQVIVDSDRSNSDNNCYWFHSYYYNIMGVELSLRRHRLSPSSRRRRKIVDSYPPSCGDRRCA